MDYEGFTADLGVAFLEAKGTKYDKLFKLYGFTGGGTIYGLGSDYWACCSKFGMTAGISGAKIPLSGGWGGGIYGCHTSIIR